jgi:hypothetical protein
MKKKICHNVCSSIYPSGCKILTLSLFILLSIFSFKASAGVIYVPKDYPKIQTAINAATDGDEIIVSPDTYYENIKFSGKNIILHSTDPTSSTMVASTIIDGFYNDSAVTFDGTETQTCILSGFTITYGHSPRGGGINGNGTLATIQYNNIINNSAYGSSPDGCGGALYDCSGTIQNNTISNNSASYSGGGLCECSGIIKNNIISNNSSSREGGGISSCGGTVQNNTISGNSAFYYGGGLNSCGGIIQNNTISNNSVNYDFGIYCGGGLYGCNGTIQNNTISTNTACSGGGLEYCNGTIQKNSITGNSANYGGGLCWCDGTIQNNTISNNSANYGYGGGLDYCGGIIQNNIISGNSATGTYGYGGGLYQCNNIIQNNLIYCNHANTGGGIYNCDGVIQNNNILENSATQQGGGLYGCQASIRNCIIWGNSAPIDAQLYDCYRPSYSCIQDWTGGGPGNITADPQLQPDKIHLTATSPCIDAGFDQNVPDFDYDGEPRPMDVPGVDNNGLLADYDIGADEYSIIDYHQINDYLLGNTSPSPEIIQQMDVNNDSKVDIADVIYFILHKK